PSEPPAPLLFSTMTCCLSSSLRYRAVRRPTMSTAPPGANGITSLTGRAGQASCARATRSRATATSVAAAVANRARRDKDRQRISVILASLPLARRLVRGQQRTQCRYGKLVELPDRLAQPLDLRVGQDGSCQRDEFLLKLRLGHRIGGAAGAVPGLAAKNLAR